MEKLGVHFVGEEEYNREILIHQGVPEAAIHILPEIGYQYGAGSRRSGTGNAAPEKDQNHHRYFAATHPAGQSFVEDTRGDKSQDDGSCRPR